MKVDFRPPTNLLSIFADFKIVELKYCFSTLFRKSISSISLDGFNFHSLKIFLLFSSKFGFLAKKDL